MEKIVRRIDLAHARGAEARQLLRREWLLTNGLGGYASATISGAVTWRYHGLLIAALPAPFGRTVMLNHLAEALCLPDGTRVQLGGEEPGGPEDPARPFHHVTEFRLENQLPVWRYDINGIILEKYVLLLHGQNTVHINYRMLAEDQRVTLQLQPSIHFRGHEHQVSEFLVDDYLLSIYGDRYEVRCGHKLPPLRLVLHGDTVNFTHDGGTKREIFYQKEADRGYESRGTLWSPGYFSVQLHSGRDATLVASTEPWNSMLALDPREALGFYHRRRRHLVERAHPAARAAAGAELVLAADQFIINPVGRVQDAARAHAAGDEIRTIIAGYHWFTDWGRDTMISFEGLTLTTGRHNEAGWILRTFAHYVRDGLIPNLFPEGENEGLYHTADATLWFFHALDRYLEYTGDHATLRLILPKLREIIDAHLRGTRFGIRVDPLDGLLTQGAEGYQLTWMDAKVDGWVVTPRRGKAVEINALWFNALRLLEEWSRIEKDESFANALHKHAARAQHAFNERFWYKKGNHLYDIVDGELGDDCACRPNQIVAFSLKYPVLDQPCWKPVFDTVRERLLTPFGLRTLDQDHPDYKPKYFGDLRARDAAYHQGTVWAWLIGPFIDAWLRVCPDDHAGARKLLEGILPHLDEACVGSISEIFDAEAPFAPRGCIAQAWSVAEALRCWAKTTEKS